MDDLNQKPAGPLSFGKSAIERDARIPEKNDAKPVDQAEWVKSAAAKKDSIFEGQNGFFAELRRKGDE